MELHPESIVEVMGDEAWMEWLSPGALQPRSFLFLDVRRVQIQLGEGNRYSESTNYVICRQFDQDKPVHLVRDVESNAQHVLKTIARLEFKLLEVVAMRKLSRKTDLVPHVKMVRQDIAAVHLHMEYLEGLTLSDAIRNINESVHADSWVRFLLVVLLTKDLMETVEKIHDLGFIHGDIHEGNIMLVKESGHVRPKVLDFGSVDEKDSNQHMDILKALIMMCWMMGIGASHFSGPERLMFNWKWKLERSHIEDDWKDFLIKVFKEGDIDDFRTCGGILAILDEKIEEDPELTWRVMEEGWQYLFSSREGHRFIQHEEQRAAGDFPHSTELVAQ